MADPRAPVPDDAASPPPADVDPVAPVDPPIGLTSEGFTRILDVAPHVTLLIDAELRVRRASAAAEVLFGRPVGELVGTSIADHIVASDLQVVAEAIAYVHDTGTYGRPLEFRVVRGDGSARSVEGIARNLLDDPDVRAYVAVVRDITDRHLIDRVLDAVMDNAVVEETLALIADLAGEQLGAAEVAIAFDLDTSRGTEVVAHGPNAGLWPTRLDEPPWSLARADVEADVREVASLPPRLASAALAVDRAGWLVAPIHRRATGERLGLLGAWFSSPGRLSPAGHQALGRLVDLAAFALERWRYDQLLLHAARHDQLTDLPNREQFFGRLRSSLGRAGDQHPVAVLYLDLDGFKAVNDTHGHGVGDRLLEIVAHRLQGSVRSGDLIARLGGDEFAVVCPGIADAGEAGDLADRLIAAVEEPVVVGALRLAVGASVGIALGQAGEDPDAVLHRADAALYAVKRSGRGAWRLAGDIEPA